MLLRFQPFFDLIYHILIKLTMLRHWQFNSEAGELTNISISKVHKRRFGASRA